MKPQKPGAWFVLFGFLGIFGGLFLRVLAPLVGSEDEPFAKLALGIYLYVISMGIMAIGLVLFSIGIYYGNPLEYGRFGRILIPILMFVLGTIGLIVFPFGS